METFYDYIDWYEQEKDYTEYCNDWCALQYEDESDQFFLENGLSRL